MSAIWTIAGADSAERMRRFAFLLTIIASLYAGYLYAPEASARYITVGIDGHRGIYNPAWMGSLTAVMSAAFLTLAGFFLVRGSVQRDRELATDDLVASSPVSKASFLLGKFGSNVAVLAIVATVTYAAALVMQLLRAENRSIDVLAYIAPLLLITLPGVAFVAAIAILFDTIKPLRGVFGGVVFLAIWMALLITPIGRTGDAAHWTPFDPFGTTPVLNSMANGVREAFGSVNLHEMDIGGADVPKGGLTTFAFSGLHWTLPLIASRLAWFAVAIVLVLAASLFFDRFASERSERRGGSKRRIDVAALIPNVSGLRLYRAELALLVNGASVWWWIGAAALAVASGVASLENVTKFVLPLALIWPVERWSSLGCRERRWHVDGIVASSPRPQVRTVLAQWMAATTVGAVICSGYLVRLLETGNTGAVFACLAVLCCVTAAALACGVIARSPRLFEGVYLVLWYLGPVNHLPELDFVALANAAPLGLSLAASAVAVVCLGTTLGVKVAAPSR